MVQHFFFPQFDLFASPELHVTEKWASFCWWKEAEAGDAFLMKAWPQRSWIFPPLPLLNQVVTKLSTQDNLEFILVAPISTYCPPMWMPILMGMINHEPLLLGRIGEVCRLSTGKKPKIPGDLAAFCPSRSLRRH